MKKLQIHYAKAINFLCFGPEGIELKFDSFDNLVHITGINYDSGLPRSNGTGKSTVAEIIVWGIYGKTIKPHTKLKKNAIVNNKIKKKAKVEVIWDDYRVVRTKSPDSLQFWHSPEHIWNKDTEITVGGSKVGTQTLIEEKIGLNYQTFTNVFVFTDDNKKCFLECDAAEKRKIVENLLCLEVYNEYFEIAKQFKKEFQDKIKFLHKEYEDIIRDEQLCKDRITKIQQQEQDWKTKTTNEIQTILTKIKTFKQQLNNSDQGVLLANWQEAQDQLTEITPKIEKLKASKQKLETNTEEARAKLDEIRKIEHSLSLKRQTVQLNINGIKNKIEQEKTFLQSLKNDADTRCTKCLGMVTEENFTYASEQANLKIEQCEVEISETQGELEEYSTKILAQTERSKKVQAIIEQATAKQKVINAELLVLTNEQSKYNKIEKPNVDANTTTINAQIEFLFEQVKDKENAQSPYADILASSKQELGEKESEKVTKNKELKDEIELLPYYEFWVNGFSDSGIRSFVIEGITPVLNEQIALVIENLLDGLYQLEFDSELNETISTNPPSGDPYAYSAMSGGEKRSLNLAVSQAFAYIMVQNRGAMPSCLFLDEVSSNVDAIGVVALHEMIRKLAVDRQVFVTTHDINLLKFLDGCTNIKLERRNFITKMVA